MDAVALGPQECMRGEVTANRVLGVGESDDVAALIDSHRCVPGGTAERAQVDDPPPVPQDSVGRAEPAHRTVTAAGDTDNLTAVVDGSGGAGRVFRQR